MSVAQPVVAVVPAFREERAIGDVVRSLASFVDDVVVVDDGSDDGTASAARAAGARVIRHRINRGQGAALETGFQYLRKRNAEVVVTFDADGQHDARDVPKLTAPILEGRADVVLGTRFGEGATNAPTLRRWLLSAAVVFTKATTGLRVSDAHNGLRAFSRAALQQIRLRQDRMAHASEILSEIARLRLRYVEAPITVRYSAETLRKGQSNLGALRILFDLWVDKGLRR